MIYRRWRESDLPAIREGVQDFEARLTSAALSVLARDAEVRDASVEAFLRAPGVQAWIAEEDGVLWAALGVVVAPSLWDRDSLEMTEGFWWARPDAPFATAYRLLCAVLKPFLDTGGGVLTMISLDSSPAGVSRLYRRLGLRPVQTIWSGRV